MARLIRPTKEDKTPEGGTEAAVRKGGTFRQEVQQKQKSWLFLGGWHKLGDFWRKKKKKKPKVQTFRMKRKPM